MVRGIACFGGIVAAGVLILNLAVPQSGSGSLRQLFAPLPTIDDAYQRGFRSDTMAHINRIRIPMQVEEVGGDEPFQVFLGGLVGEYPDPENIDLDDVFNAIQAEFPGAQYLAANLITSRDRESLLSKLTGWRAAVNSDFDTVNTVVFTSGRRIGALGVMSRRIPAFTLARANAEGGRFFNRCPHCGEVHALEIAPESRTLILSCPYCDLPFDVLAADTSGKIRRATDFFEGFQLVEHPAARRQLTPEQRIVGLWKQIADRCEYQLDQDHSNIREVWKSSRETWEEKAGDCEDTSILLADALISAGFEARVAIGWNGNIGQHAWVVVKVGEQQYVVESTLQNEITMASLAPVAEAAPFYQPEQLFDRSQIYFTQAEPDQFKADYFSPDLWEAIPARATSQEPTPRRALSMR